MDQRIIKYYLGELSTDEKKSLLIEASHDAELKQQMMNYQNVQSLMLLSSERKNKVQGKKSYDRFIYNRNQEKKRKLFLITMRYAAIVIVCVLFTWTASSIFFNTNKASVSMQELYVPAGQRAQIVLPDGSKVWLNAGSHLNYPSVFEGERRVRLSGEAFFEVKKGKVPFIVSTGKIDVKVLGTKFNVFNYPKEPLSISLLQGSVCAYSPNDMKENIVLKPNQMLIEKKGHYQVNEITDDPILWKDGLYAFNNKKMTDIIKKLELYYDVEIVVKDRKLLDYEYTGKFRQRDGVKEVLRLIQKIYPFKIKEFEGTNKFILYN